MAVQQRQLLKRQQSSRKTPVITQALTARQMAAVAKGGPKSFLKRQGRLQMASPPLVLEAPTGAVRLGGSPLC